MSSPFSFVTGLLAIGGLTLVSFKLVFPNVSLDSLKQKTRTEVVGNCVVIIDNDTGQTLNKECKPPPVVVTPPQPTASIPTAPATGRYDNAFPPGYTVATNRASDQLRRCFSNICITYNGARHCMQENVHYKLLQPTNPSEFRNRVLEKIRAHPAWQEAVPQYEACIAQVGGRRGP